MSERQREVAREHMRRLWADPAFRAERAAMASKTLAETNRRPDRRARQSERMTQQNTDPDFARARLAAVAVFNGRAEVKAQKSARISGLNRDPAFRALQEEGQVRGGYHSTGIRVRLPVMTLKERRQYKKLREAGYERQRAIHTALEGRYREGMYGP